MKEIIEHSIISREKVHTIVKKKTKQPIVLTNHVSGDHGGQQYNEAETKAQKEAGFKVKNTNIFDMPNFITDKNAQDSDCAGAYILPRHYAGEDTIFSSYIERNNGILLIPDYHLANSWYKIVPQDSKADYWLKRRVAWIDTSMLCNDSEDDYSQWQSELCRIVGTMFGFAKHRKVFIKATGKRSIDSTLYSFKQAVEALTYHFTFQVHGKLTEVIYSEPMQIAKDNNEFGKAEYRCFVVDGQVSSMSIYTDRKLHLNGDVADMLFFANEFAQHFYKRLPLAYCLDIARLADGSLAMVELNDIGGSGFYAQHDIQQVFQDIYKLREEYIS